MDRSRVIVQNLGSSIDRSKYVKVVSSLAAKVDWVTQVIMVTEYPTVVISEHARVSVRYCMLIRLKPQTY